MEHADFVEGYGAAIEAGHACLLVGAGLSMGANYPGWAELLEPIAKEFGVPAMSDLPLQAQYIENISEGRKRLGDHLAASIGSVEPVPLENHILLAQLGLRDTWTTNYDSLIESADTDLAIIERDQDLVDRASGQRRLNKMHGSIPHGATEPTGGRDQLVLSRQDYELYEQTHPRLWRLLQAQFLTSSFLFLGFSLTDPNFEAVFKIARLATADKLMPHYAVMKRDEDSGAMFDLRANDLRNAGVELVEISSYDEITTLLQRLVARTRPARLFVSGSSRSPEDGVSSDATSYPTAETDAELDDFARQLGAALAGGGIPAIAAAGAVGAQVGYSFLSALSDYDPDRFLLVRRRSPDEVGPPSLRQGQIHFIGDEPDVLRAAAFEHVRAVVVVGGGPGTEREARQALELGMTVVPLGHTGGAAREVWTSMSETIDSYHAGQRPIPRQAFDDLASDDSKTAIAAAVHLIRVGLFLPPD